MEKTIPLTPELLERCREKVAKKLSRRNAKALASAQHCRKYAVASRARAEDLRTTSPTVAVWELEDIAARFDRLAQEYDVRVAMYAYLLAALKEMPAP